MFQSDLAFLPYRDLIAVSIVQRKPLKRVEKWTPWSSHVLTGNATRMRFRSEVK